MDEVVVDFSGLASVSRNLNAIAANFQDSMEQFRKISQEIVSSNTWLGNDQEQYLTMIQQKYMTSLKKIQHAMVDYADFLMDASEVYRNLENIMGEQPAS